jgi:myo-inositol 2-dehydrogenase/D-chiro-inositol 1-dehydrogenase
MAAEPLRVGILGTGRMHAEIVARQIPGAAVAVLYDADDAAARDLGEWLGVPTAASAAEVIASPDVDAVAICTPTGLQARQVIDAARAGKAIFCEKPVSLDLAEVDRALTAVADAGVPFQVGFNQRFDPGHAAVAAAVAEGRVGEPHLVRITSRDPAPPPLDYARGSGGIFLDMTIHDFDMARHLVGSEVREVYVTLHYSFLDRYAASYVAEWCEFASALRDGRDPQVGLHDARAPIVIGLAAWRSVREHRPVRTAEIATDDCLASAQPTPTTTT